MSLRNPTSEIGQINYLQGRSLGLDPIRCPDPQKRLEVADFHDIIALAFYGETFVDICGFIRIREALSSPV